MLRLARWLRDIAAETARNPLVWAGRPWRGWLHAVMVAMLVLLWGLGCTTTACTLVYAIGLVERGADWGSLLRLEALVGVPCFHVAFGLFARDFRRGNRLVELGLTRLSPREIVLGSVFWGVAGGALAVLVMHAGFCAAMAWLGDAPIRAQVYVDDWAPLDAPNSALVSFALGAPKLWPLLVVGYVTTSGWLASPGLLASTRTLLKALFLCLFLGATAGTIGSRLPDLFGLGELTLEFRLNAAPVLALPLLEALLAPVLAISALAGVCLAGPAAYFAGTETTFTTGTGWRWLAREGRRDKDRLRAARRELRAPVLAFWKDAWGGVAIGLLLAFLLMVAVVVDRLERDLGSEIPLMGGIVAACVMTVWSRVRAGGRLRAAPALLGRSMAMHQVPVLIAGTIGCAAVLEVAGYYVEGDTPLRRAGSLAWWLPWLSWLFLLGIPWMETVFLLAATRMRRWLTIALAWSPVVVPVVLTLGFGALMPEASISSVTWRWETMPLLLIGVPLPFAGQSIIIQVGELSEGADGLYLLGHFSLLTAMILFALRHAGLHEILMQRFHDRELAGLGLYEISGGDGDAKPAQEPSP